jgi:hypothetical protein
MDVHLRCGLSKRRRRTTEVAVMAWPFSPSSGARFRTLESPSDTDTLADLTGWTPIDAKAVSDDGLITIRCDELALGSNSVFFSDIQIIRSIPKGLANAIKRPGPGRQAAEETKRFQRR